ncbi:hypothetical protein Zmor_014148 [Zophobas morio]|uniref:Uncharacterized protein n=1 Tax=Zophobas morio TaxID=2755281 RepID=A0AA38IFH8_9CUCU|nr:hypothetical protein Zmor_014148 [Zophobas morio]
MWTKQNGKSDSSSKGYNKAKRGHNKQEVQYTSSSLPFLPMLRNCRLERSSQRRHQTLDTQQINTLACDDFDQCQFTKTQKR